MGPCTVKRRVSEFSWGLSPLSLPECTAAALALQRQPEIAVDIEGVNLCRNGILSLLQIADPDTVHIFDKQDNIKK